MAPKSIPDNFQSINPYIFIRTIEIHLNKRLVHILFFLFLISFQSIFAQDKIEKEFLYSSDTIQFDTVSVFRTGFELRINSQLIPDSLYYLNTVKAKLVLYKGNQGDVIKISYEPTPFNLNIQFAHKSTKIIISDTTKTIDPFLYSVSSANPNQDLFGSSKLNKQGSISRGVTVGNAQNLSLQSTLNLQLDGQIAPNLFLKGSISDDNVPFQPEGNTQKLQEFDQVYLQVYNDNFAVIGGDFWLKKPTGYFLNYNKRTQGVSVEGYHDMAWLGLKGTASHKVSGAFSRGKFTRNVIQGVEGNQGPYRIVGAENETFIVILAGTEKVFLDGKLMTRGQEFDYTIDYNTAEITFTANNLITKDVRIIVECQYSDLNYARSLLAYNADFKGEKYQTWVNVYSEQDAKNQMIQQNLTDEKKLVLSQIGDSLFNAFSNSIDSVGYFENRILYKLVDSLGFDSVLVFTANSDSAIYQAFFSQVPFGQGDYVFERFTANGRVYKWVAPIGGERQGNYAPIQLLIAPQKKQMFVVGTEYKFTKNISSFLEVALSNQDANTFSSLDAADNQGTAVKWKLNSLNNIDSLRGLQLASAIAFEYNHANFRQIQWFRSVEFDRDWNVRNKAYFGDQYLSNASIKLLGKNWGGIGYNFENFIWGNDYSGIRNNANITFQKNGWKLLGDGSLLVSNGTEASNFLRHQLDFSKTFNAIKLGFQDIQETNKQALEGDPTLLLSSYRFYDWKTYIATGDSTKNQFELYYRERYDWFSDSTRLNRVAKAQNVGFEAGFTKNIDHIFRLSANYRSLQIEDSTLFKGKPENTVLGRLEHVLRLWKGTVAATSFYEVGSGLELRREFLFLEVNPGQGTHTWIDYNNDNIKDLGEFEIAVFVDQGNYIRVFVPTNTYVRAYTNQFTSSVTLSPESIWRTKTGVKKLLARFSNQTVYKVDRKTSYEDNFQLLNPFVYGISDTSLVSLNTSFRNTFYFNKTNSVLGLNYTYQENGSKILLTNGFDTRLNTFHEVQFRWNLNKFINFRVNSTLGRKKNASDYALGRNYFIEYLETIPILSFQPNSAFRIALNGKYSQKLNNSELAEKAQIRDIGIDLRYNQAQKGSLTGRFNYINITYNGTANSSIAFEMLEGLKTGNNFTWGLSYQRKVATNLQLNFNYNGRKSEATNTIHSGGMELRAFF